MFGGVRVSFLLAERLMFLVPDVVGLFLRFRRLMMRSMVRIVELSELNGIIGVVAIVLGLLMFILVVRCPGLWWGNEN